MAAVSQYLQRWQTYALLLGACSLVGTMLFAYSTTYSALDLGWHWVAARYWLSGGDVYSADATYVLRGIRSETASGYPYPFPVILMVLPLALMPLPVASTIWGLCSIAALVALPFIVCPKPRAWMILPPFMFFSFWAAMEQAQFGPILLGIMLISIVAQQAGRLRLAGAVLPLLMVKPQIGLTLFLAIAALTYIRGIDRRWFEGVALGCLIWWGTSLLIKPDWPIGFLNQLRYYAGEDLNSVLAQTPSGAILTVLASFLAFLAWRQRDQPGLVASIMLLGMLVFPMRSVYNQVVFLLPLILYIDRYPRLVTIAIAASWSVIFLLPLKVPSLDVIVLSLYLPLAALVTWDLIIKPRVLQVKFAPSHNQFYDQGDKR